jgi:AraC family transcriptional regulator, ethanolamine operon transcriptional activator
MVPAMPPISVQRAPLPGTALGCTTRSHYSDIDEQAAALTGWHQRYLQLSRGRFDGTVQRLQLDGVGLFIEDLHPSVHQTGWVRPDVFALGVPLSLEGDAQFCGQPANGDTLHVFSGHGGFEFRSPQRHVMIGIEVDRPLFDAHIAQAAGEHTHADRAGLHHADPAVLSELRGFLTDLFQNAGPVADQHDTATHAPLRKQVRTQLLDRIALALAPHEAAAPERGARATAAQSALVVRATGYVASRLGDPPSVGEMCESLGVSRRTLQSAFQVCWGMGPLAWLTTLRLNAVRRRLKSADSVTEAATEFGFWHFGHFAGDYQALFGECPSHTLRRHRRTVGHLCPVPQTTCI